MINNLNEPNTPAFFNAFNKKNIMLKILLSIINKIILIYIRQVLMQYNSKTIIKLYHAHISRIYKYARNMRKISTKTNELTKSN